MAPDFLPLPREPFVVTRNERVKSFESELSDGRNAHQEKDLKVLVDMYKSGVLGDLSLSVSLLWKGHMDHHGPPTRTHDAGREVSDTNT